MAGKNRWGAKLVLIFALLAITALFIFASMQRFANSPISIPNGSSLLSVEKGDGLNNVIHKIRKVGVQNGADWQWKILAVQMNMAGKIHVGDYELTNQITPTELLNKLAIGDTARVKFTIVEGWNFKQLMQQLSQLNALDDDLSGKTSEQIMAQIGKPGVHPEGRFLPETYIIPRSGQKSQVLLQATQAMDKTLAETWQKRESNSPLKSAEELLILASIVEKETGQAHERPQIAGVFIRRINLGMRLQTDPTVIYGMGDAYQGNIRKQDLSTDNAYNTYTRAGLPPTPIAMPGRAALLATAHPAAGDELYFVAKDNREHHFSSSYKEHQQAVKQYQMKKIK
jgi:UPF0755 protein